MSPLRLELLAALRAFALMWAVPGGNALLTLIV